MKNNKIKRAISFLIIFSIVFSAMYYGLSTGVNWLTRAQTPGELIYNGSLAAFNSDVVSISGENVDLGGKTNYLKDKEYDVRSFGGDGQPPVFHNSNLDLMADGFINFVDVYSGKTVDLVFSLEETIKPEHFLMINRAEKNLQTFEYKIYGGKTFSEALAEENLLGSFKRTDSGSEDKQINLFKLTNASEIKYFRISLLKGNATDNYSFRFCEIALLGSKTAEKKIDNPKEGEYTSIPTKNALTAKSKTFSFCGNNYSGVYNTVNLDDGAVSEFSASALFADYNEGNVLWNTNGNKYFDIIYDFGSEIDLQSIYILNHAKKFLRTGHYELYAAKAETELFDNDAIAEFKNGAASQSQTWSFKDITARFVALRILDPVTDHGTNGLTTVTASQNNIYPRLLEFRVYGEKKAAAPDPVELVFDGTLENGAKEGIFSLEDKEIISSSPNLLEGKTVDVGKYTSDGWKGNLSSANIGFLTNGEVEGTSGADAYTGDYIDFNFFLNDKVLPDYFVMLNRKEKNLQTYKYYIYGAESYAELEKSDALLAIYERNDNGAEDKQCNIFKFNKDIPIKYLRIRVISPNASFDKGARICEMMLYGSVSDKAPDSICQEDNFSDIPSFESNLKVNSVTIEMKHPEDSATTPHGMSSSAYLYDGASDNEFSAYAPFARYDEEGTKWFTDGSAFVTITYDFGSEADVSEIVLLNHSNLYLRTGHYELYASNNKKSLYDSENKVAEYVNNNKYQRQLYSFSGEVKGRYLGLKILDPVNDHDNTPMTSFSTPEQYNYVTPRLLEFSAFGKYTDANYLNQPTVEPINEKAQGKELMSDEEFAKFGKSIIYNQKAILRMNNIRVTELENSASRLTDGIVKTVYHPDGSVTVAHQDFSGNNITGNVSAQKPFDVIYKIADGETPYDIDKFIFLGNGDTSPLYVTGHYAVFAAESMDELFLPESKLYEYNYENDGIARGHIITFKENYKPRVCYMAVRIYNPVSGATEWVYPRISEIAIYGKKADIPTYPTNLANNMPIEAYLENAKGELERVSEKNLSVQEVSNLTDGDNTTEASIKTSSKKLEIIYNLCNEAEISIFSLKSVEGKELKEFKIYASTDLNKVWREESLIYHYEGAKNKTLENGKIFSKPKKVRYIRVSVINSGQKNYCDIAEINIIGLDNQLLKYKSLTGGITAENVVFYEQDLKTDEIKYIELGEAKALGLFDSDKGTGNTVWGGKEGEKSFNILFYLGDLRNIGEIEAIFLKNRDHYWAEGMEVYLGEDEESVLDTSAKPDYTFGKVNSEKVSKKFIPKLARYVRISFKKQNPKLAKIYEAITVALTEIVIKGTAIKGQQRADEYDGLLSFSDKKTGISWEIVRLDQNDIFTRVASSKLVKAKATSAQKASLVNNTYYELRSNETYEIKFYDLTGAEVTEFNGRKIRVLTPATAKETLGGVLLGSVASKEVIQLLDSYPVEKGNKHYVAAEYSEDMGYKFAVAQLDDSDEMYEDILNSNESQDFENQDFTEQEFDEQETSPETGEPWIPIVSALSAFVSAAFVLFYGKRKEKA